MRKFTIALAGAGALLFAVVAPAQATDPSPTANVSTVRYETTLVGNVETATMPGATVVYVHVTNSAAIKRDHWPKFLYQFKGVIVPVKLDTKTAVRRLSGEDHVTMSATGLAALTTIPMLAGDRITAKVRCTAVNPPDCIATRIEVLTPPPKQYSVTFVGRVTTVTDSRTAVARPSIVLRDGDHATQIAALVATDVKVLATNATHLVVNGVKSTGTLTGVVAGQLAVVEARCLAPVAPSTQWVCTASDVTAATLA